MAKDIIATDSAPAAIGPYSQAVRAGNLLFSSGQIALDPSTGEMLDGGVEAQTRRVLDNLTAVLEAGGATRESVLKVTIYLQNMSDFARVNAVYGEYFGAEPPARACVEVSALPKGALVEMDAIAQL